MKKITLIITAVLLTINVFGQAPNWAWAYSAGGTDLDVPASVITDASGNVYIAGSFTSTTMAIGAFTLTNHTVSGSGYTDIFIAKYNSSGTVLWAQSFGGAYTDVGSAIATDASGNVYLTGSTGNVSIVFGTDTLAQSGFFIAKFNSAGVVQWAFSSSSISGGLGEAIDIDNAGNILVTGYNDYTMTFGSYSVTSAGTNDLFVAKFDSNGNPIWLKGAGSTYSEEGRGIATDASGNVFVTGDFNSSAVVFGTITLNNSQPSFPGDDMFIVKYDAGGNVLWAQSAVGVFAEYANGIATDAAGNAYVTGYFNSHTLTFGTTAITNSDATFNSNDIFTVKYSATGTVVWVRRDGMAIGSIAYSQDYSHAIYCDGGNIYITGSFAGTSINFGTYTLTNASGSGADETFVTKIDAAGNVIWAKSTSCVGNDVGKAITGDATGNIYICATWGGGTISFAGFTPTHYGGLYDVALAKLGSTLGINETTVESETSIYPNPFASTTTISFSEEQKNTTIKVMDVIGQCVLQPPPLRGGREGLLDMSGYAKGVYFVRIEDENKNIINRKIIKE